MGKTLQTIALIVCGVDAYKYTARGTKEKVSNENPTLIVAPVSVMSNWTEQVRITLLGDACDGVLEHG